MEWVSTYKYEREELAEIEKFRFGRNWPVVYILEGKNEAYIGETTDVYRRSKEHYINDKRQKLDLIHVISDEEFNKSATIDIEALLIEHIAADGKYLLQNGNIGHPNHNYYEREKYKTKFKLIWNELQNKKITIND